MPDSSHRHRPLARRALLDAVGSRTPHPHQVLEAFAALRARLTTSLEPLFGQAAVDTLFERSRHLAADEFAWLPPVLPSTTAGSTRGEMPAVSGADMLDGLGAVLAHDVGLLAAFVGDDVILPMIHKAWLPGGSAPVATDESN